jgi:hypothetical protein
MSKSTNGHYHHHNHHSKFATTNGKASAVEQHHGKEYSNFKAKSSVSQKVSILGFCIFINELRPKRKVCNKLTKLSSVKLEGNTLSKDLRQQIMRAACLIHATLRNSK